MKTLHLVLKYKWYDMIKSGVKKEEYREIKEYWRKRLIGQEYDAVMFHRGYRTDRESIAFEIQSIHIGQGNIDWGAVKDESYFIIELGKKLINNGT